MRKTNPVKIQVKIKENLSSWPFSKKTKAIYSKQLQKTFKQWKSQTPSKQLMNSIRGQLRLKIRSILTFRLPSSSESSVWDDRKLTLLIRVAEIADVADWQVPVSKDLLRKLSAVWGFSNGESTANPGGGGNVSLVTSTASSWGFKGVPLKNNIQYNDIHNGKAITASE